MPESECRAKIDIGVSARLHETGSGDGQLKHEVSEHQDVKHQLNCTGICRDIKFYSSLSRMFLMFGAREITITVNEPQNRHHQQRNDRTGCFTS